MNLCMCACVYRSSGMYVEEDGLQKAYLEEGGLTIDCSSSNLLSFRLSLST